MRPPTPTGLDYEDFLKDLTNLIAAAEAQWEYDHRPYAITEEIRAEIHRKVVKAWVRQVDGALDKVKARFAEHLLEDSEKWPRKWMMNDGAIRKRLRISPLRPDANPWSQVMNYLWKKSGHLKESQRLAKLLPEDLRTEAGTFRPYAFLTVDLGELEAATGISRRHARKYLQVFVEAGFIRDTGHSTARRREGGKKIYAIGVWAGHLYTSHRIPYLVDSRENREKLRGFALPRL